MEQQRVRIFKTRPFERFSRKNRITDADLLKAMQELISGLVEADLGSGVFKKRVARKGEGKSGGFRTIIAFRRGSTAFFVYGFAKKDMANIEDSELRQLKELAEYLLALDNAALDFALLQGKLIEVSYA